MSDRLFVSGLPDINGAHALIRLALLAIVVAVGIWRLRALRRRE